MEYRCNCNCVRCGTESELSEVHFLCNTLHSVVQYYQLEDNVFHIESLAVYCVPNVESTNQKRIQVFFGTGKWTHKLKATCLRLSECKKIPKFALLQCLTIFSLKEKLHTFSLIYILRLLQETIETNLFKHIRISATAIICYRQYGILYEEKLERQLISYNSRRTFKTPNIWQSLLERYSLRLSR